MGADQSSISHSQPGNNSLSDVDIMDNPSSGNPIPSNSSNSTEQNVPSPPESIAESDLGNESQNKNGTKSSPNFRQKLLKRMGSLVVVNPGKQHSTDVETDQMYLRLQQIPDYNPIIHNRDKISWSKEGEEIRSRLDPSPLMTICYNFLNELNESSRSVSTTQNQLTKQIKEIDASTKKLIKGYTERQKKSAKYADQLNKINDLSKGLSKCQSVLNECKHTIQTLNSLLPPEERLEPFVWAEDTELVDIKIYKDVSSSCARIN